MSLYNAFLRDCDICGKKKCTSKVYNSPDPIEVIGLNNKKKTVEGFCCFCNVCLPEKFKNRTIYDNRYNTE